FFHNNQMDGRFISEPRLFTLTLNISFLKPSFLENAESWSYSRILVDRSLKPTKRIPYLKTTFKNVNNIQPDPTLPIPLNITIVERLPIDLYSITKDTQSFKQSVDGVLYVYNEELPEKIRKVYEKAVIAKNKKLGKNNKRPLD